MKQMLTGLAALLRDLDRITVTHTLRCHTAVKDARTDEKRCCGKDLRFRFSALRGLLLGILLLISLAGLLLSAKKRIEKKLLRRLEKKGQLKTQANTESED